MRFFRLFSTRGHDTHHVWCDNGTSFKAGSKALSQCFRNVEWKGVIDSGVHVAFLDVIFLLLLLQEGSIGKEWYDLQKI